MAYRPLALDKDIHSINDLKIKGSAKLPREFSEYFNEGAMDMLTLKDNEEAFNRYRIRPRLLTDVSDIDPSTTVFGTKVSFPFGFSPAAMHALAHPEGEVGTSRAAAKVGAPMLLSTYSTMSMEDVIAEGTGNPYAFQITMVKDRTKTREMIKRAEGGYCECREGVFDAVLTKVDAGYKAIVLTVDCPVLGRRLNEMKNTFKMPAGSRYPNVDRTADAGESLDVGGEGMRYGQRPTIRSIESDFSTDKACQRRSCTGQRLPSSSRAALASPSGSKACTLEKTSI